MFPPPFTKWMSAAVFVAALVLTMTENSDAQETITTSSGLQYIEHEVGSGDIAKAGDTVDVHYTGWLYNDGEKGTKFDSSVDRGQTFSFPLGAGRVIKGWDEGVCRHAAGRQTHPDPQARSWLWRQRRRRRDSPERDPDVPRGTDRDPVTPLDRSGVHTARCPSHARTYLLHP